MVEDEKVIIGREDSSGEEALWDGREVEDCGCCSVGWMRLEDVLDDD